jgi:hypothetical protein
MLGVGNQLKSKEVLVDGIIGHHFGPCGIKGRENARSPEDQGDSRHAVA